MLLSAGYDEAFTSTQQLLQCVRPGILLDAASVPSVQITNRNGQVLPLNRYILDYWGHSQKQALVHANGLREGVLLIGFQTYCCRQRWHLAYPFLGSYLLW